MSRISICAPRAIHLFQRDQRRKKKCRAAWTTSSKIPGSALQTTTAMSYKQQAPPQSAPVLLSSTSMALMNSSLSFWLAISRVMPCCGMCGLEAAWCWQVECIYSGLRLPRATRERFSIHPRKDKNHEGSTFSTITILGSMLFPLSGHQ
jgi:hypothetical protein